MIRRYYVQLSTSAGGGGGGGWNVVQLAVSINENTICSESPNLYFISDQYSTISPGVVVYTNPLLTLPLSGFNYAKTNAGIIYAIDELTGEVLAPTGNVC